MAESDCILTATVVDINASIVVGYGVIRGRYVVRASAISASARFQMMPTHEVADKTTITIRKIIKTLPYVALLAL